MPSTNTLYSELLLDLYRHPLNKQTLSDFDVRHTETNPLCGEDVEVFIKFNEHDRVENIGWQGNGCAISQAASSVATDLVKGKSKEEILEMNKDTIAEQLGLENLNPTRMRCVLLGMTTIQQSLSTPLSLLCPSSGGRRGRPYKQKTMSLTINNLHISTADKQIVHGLDFTIKPGEVHAIMGPNGSGKSTLANTLMGHPKYSVTKGTIELNKLNITNLSPDKRAKAGLFLSMQYPPEIPGVSIANFLRQSAGALRGQNQNPITFHKELNERMRELSIDPSFASRHINLGFSGGERKRIEILQLLILNPTYAILDETDSGLDVDALKVVADGINRFCSPEHGIILITHYNRILEYVVPDFVHIMVSGKIVKSGGAELAKKIEQTGYQQI